MRERFLNIVVVVSAVVLSLVGLEAAVRILDVGEQAAATHRLHAVSPTDRLRFVAHSQAVVETQEYRYVQKANAYGRRDVDWSAEMLANPCNVILVGDSFVMGFGMDDDWVLDRLLEHHYAMDDRCVDQVFNFGMGGEVSTPEYKQLLTHAIKLGITAKTVMISLFVGNDFSMEAVLVQHGRADASEGSSTFHLPQSKLARFILDRVKYSTRMTGFVLQAGGFLGLRTYLSRDAYIYQRDYSDKEQQHFDDAMSVLLTMREMSMQDGRDYYVIVFPNKVQVENFPDLNNSVYDAERPNRLIRQFCSRYGLHCLDLLPVLRRHYDLHGTPLYFQIDRHLSKEGNAVAAQEIYAFLKAHAGPE